MNHSADTYSTGGVHNSLCACDCCSKDTSHRDILRKTYLDISGTWTKLNTDTAGKLQIKPSFSQSWSCPAETVTGIGTGPADPAAARPITWQTKMCMFTLYQLSWTWIEPWSLFLFGHCRFLQFTAYFTLGKNAYTVVIWFSGKLANLLPPDVRF